MHFCTCDTFDIVFVTGHFSIFFILVGMSSHSFYSIFQRLTLTGVHFIFVLFIFIQTLGRQALLRDSVFGSMVVDPSGLGQGGWVEACPWRRVEETPHCCVNFLLHSWGVLWGCVGIEQEEASQPNAATSQACVRSDWGRLGWRQGWAGQEAGPQLAWQAGLRGHDPAKQSRQNTWTVGPILFEPQGSCWMRGRHSGDIPIVSSLYPQTFPNSK